MNVMNRLGGTNWKNSQNDDTLWRVVEKKI